MLITTTGVIVIAVLSPPGITRVPTIAPTVDFQNAFFEKLAEKVARKTP